jgi:hypothetical protein
VAPSKRDGAGSSRMGIAHHGERSIFRSVLGLGEPLSMSLEGAVIALEGAKAV